jgi:hypothetical protein
MSSRASKLIDFPDDPRKTEFVLSLLEKTREGKVSWLKKGNAYTTTILNGFVINFILGPEMYGLRSRGWQLFTVRDEKSNELISLSPLGPSPSEEGSLVVATDQLFAAVSGLSGNALERAIQSLKKL